MFFFNFSSLIFSQEFRDSGNNERISFIEIYDDNGNLIVNTGAEGVVNQAFKDKILKANTKHLTFVNSLYENKKVEISQFGNNTIFYMNPIIKLLDTVKITSTKNKNQYLFLKTYIRSLQINDGKIQYFIDGIVEYYISLKTKKIKLKFLSNRSYENRSISQLKEKGLSKIYFQVVGAPMINKMLNYENLAKEYDFENTKTNIIINKNNIAKGYFNLNSIGSSLELQIVSEGQSKKMKGLGVENILKNYSLASCFNTNSLESMDLSKLMFFKEVRMYDVKNNKEKKYHSIEATHEVFVLNSEFLDSINVNNFDSNYTFNRNSNYTEKYWEKINNALFKPLPETITKFISENLTENSLLKR